MINSSETDGVLNIEIDRQDRRNALDHDAVKAMLEALDGAEDARVVVISGAGGHFCAGADLKTLEDEAYTVTLRRLLDRLRTIGRPTIAAIEGAALGAGTQLAISCDLRMATPDAILGIPAGKLGLMVDHATVLRLVELAGHGTTSAMLLAAERGSGAEALRIGFVQREGGVAEGLAWAAEIATLAPISLAGHKLGLLMKDDDDGSYAAAFAGAWASKDLQEGRAAFDERRSPAFRGR